MSHHKPKMLNAVIGLLCGRKPVLLPRDRVGEYRDALVADLMLRRVTDRNIIWALKKGGIPDAAKSINWFRTMGLQSRAD